MLSQTGSPPVARSSRGQPSPTPKARSAALTQFSFLEKGYDMSFNQITQIKIFSHPDSPKQLFFIYNIIKKKNKLVLPLKPIRGLRACL